MSDRFFEELPAFSTFNDLTENSNYHEVPDDWWVVVTDVIGSTKAIEAGRYKDVNTVGAATLVALRNAIPDVEIPFVFGGDGASAAFPGSFKEPVTRELSALRTLATDRFGLGLRVGMVAASELRALGSPLRVARYLLEGRYPLAMFRGGALSLADRLVKESRDRYEVPVIEGARTDLIHLSCRWQAIEASRGCALAILAVDPEDRTEVMAELLRGIDTILDPGTERSNPVRTTGMTYRGLREMWSSDGRFGSTAWSRFYRRFESFVAFLLFNLKLGMLAPRIGRYVAATPAHSDFRKYDDMLRMVIDCSPGQADRIEELCEDFRTRHGLVFGLHRNRASLMTCYVPGFGDGQHVHFIDGADGGYALAAKQLKQQLKEPGPT